MNTCYVIVPLAPKGQRIGRVELGETGYYPTDLDRFATEAECDQHRTALNTLLGIPPEIADSMEIGSMFGWRCQAAQPAILFFAATTTTVN